MNDEEWAVLSKERLFRTGEENQARQKIDGLYLALSFFMIKHDDVSVIERKLKVMLRAIKRLQKSLDQMLPLSVSKVYHLGSNGRVIKSPHKSVLTADQIESLGKAVNLLLELVEQKIVDIPSGQVGPATDEAYFLVAELNQIVQTYSDGGPLVRSDKSILRGNDVQFVTQFFRIGERKFKKSFRSGTITNTIRQLKRGNVQPFEITNVSFDFEVDEGQHPLIVGLTELKKRAKSALQS